MAALADYMVVAPLVARGEPVVRLVLSLKASSLSVTRRLPEHPSP